ncbi:MAG: cation diffusion facilitator family transporter [Verrucomicrobia bacterium]|nr:cation diffusion facilitator family transporter [Verrucomicrobiota bacterium]MDE3099968.1 cation transporter [Verrucomicrobiota bacterium]
MASNAVLSLAKFAAGVAGHSHALVADAIESLADVLTSVAVWRGSVLAAAPPDEDHPYGHGKAEPLAAAIVSAMMLFAAGWIVLKSFGEIALPHKTPAAYTLFVLVGAVIVKEALFRFTNRQGTLAGNMAVRADATHHRSDAITSFAAGVGISVSLVGGKGYEAADDWAAIAAACVIAWNGLRQLRPALSELMDKAPGHDVSQRIRRLAETIPGVERVEKCMVRKMGHQLYVDMHLEVNPRMTVLRSHEIAHEVKDKIRDIMPVVNDVLVHVEPIGIPAPHRQG